MYEVPVAWIRHVMAECGVGSDVGREALRAAGLRPALVADPTRRVPASSFADFIEAAARISGNDTFGIAMGRSYDLRASGLAAYPSIVAGTLREAMRNATRYGALNDNAADYALGEAGPDARFRIETRSARLRGSRHATEFKTAFIVAAVRRWAGASFRPQEMRFAHPRASSLREVERFFGCPLRFGAEATEMIVSHEQLALPGTSADPYLLDLLIRHADDLLAERSPRPELRAEVERLVLQRLPQGAPTASEVAGELGLGERTLARRLTAEGAPFRQVVEDLRRDMAMRYLEDRGLSLAQISYLLGYADQSAFTNAFRRWTGHSPRRFRADGARPA